METVRNFILGGSKITADGDCSHLQKLKTLAPWKKSYDQPRQHIKKQRKVCPVKVLVLPVVIYGCEIWTIKKAEH